MRICLVVLYCLIASAVYPLEALKIPAADQNAPRREQEEKEFRFYPGGKMTIMSKLPGSIRIIGWEKGTVRVELEKIARGVSPDEAKSLFERYPLRVRYDQTSAKIEVDGKPVADESIEYNLAIYVPGYKTDLKADIARGAISVDAVNGWIEVSTGQGRLEASSLSGYYSGNTRDGDVRVEMSGPRWRGLELGAVTLAGSVELVLPENYSASLQLETLDGNVIVDYPPQTVDGETVPLNVGVRKKAQALDASIGSGGAPVKLVSHMGDIRLSRKK
jgi:DUF4097 and DUF4098 domain-containing protein YvlB